jgi:threonine synthase
MKYYSTNNKNNTVSFKEAVIKGIPEDGGLFMPSEIRKLPEHFFENISKYSFKEISFFAAQNLFNSDIPKSELEKIIDSAITFDAPLVSLNNQIKILELFHGPTLAFKDFGARFMANILSYLNKSSDKEITILVATSGDTGSAVANGFYNIDGINVILLYPSNKVSKIQEQQLTTLDKNITALEILGTFDDCQKLVKQAFLDKNITSIKKLTSANSINLARLLPQSFYYFNAYAQLEDKSLQTIISVPSGNFGNLTAGLIAKRMGLPVNKFIAATNLNDIFPKYLETLKYHPKPSIKTLSNAMDVGDPSNFKRILDLYNHDHQKIKNDIYSESFSDEDTISAMKEVHSNYKYLIDPHGAVGYLALKSYIKELKLDSFSGIILETAHPGKFADIFEKSLNRKIEIPDRLNKCLTKEKHSIKLSSSYKDFKEFLMN